MTSGARPASEPEAGQAPRLCRQGHQRRAWLDAIHVPRRRSLRGCVERGSDARPAVVGFGRPALVRPRLRNTRHRRRLGHSRRVTLDDDVRVADRHRDRTPRIARDIARLQRARARLEPERVVEPQGADRGHMRAAVLVDGGQPGRAEVDRVRSWRRPRSELRNNCGPIHRWQPVHRTQIDDLHEASLHRPGHILADGISYIRRATTAELIADTRVEPARRGHQVGFLADGALELLPPQRGYLSVDNELPKTGAPPPRRRGVMLSAGSSRLPPVPFEDGHPRGGYGSVAYRAMSAPMSAGSSRPSWPGCRSCRSRK